MEGFRVRDLLILTLCATAILFSLQFEGNWSHKYSFNFVHNPNLLQNVHFPSPDEKIPPPVVTDLDGDGLNEIIILTREPDIQVYEFQELSNEKNGNLKLKFSSPLALETRVIKKRQPAAVGVGYFDLYKPNQPTRKQYIVILNQGWSILCYNHKLELLWERSIDFQIPKDYYIKESTILIIPGNVQGKEDSKGIVIVGGRIAKVTDDHTLEIGHKHSKRVVGEEFNENGEGEPILSSSELEHFSYFAFEGLTGKQLWKHESSDFLHTTSGPIEEGEYLQSHFKVDARIPSKHEGESDWRKYRQSLLNALPHRWRYNEDTFFQLASFQKNKKKGTTQASTFHQDVTGFSSFPNLYGTSDEEENQGNVVVAHLHDSIEVLQLYSGQPLCRVKVGGDFHGKNGIYADVNGDGVIDHIRTVTGKYYKAFGFRSTGKKPILCHGVVFSGIPPTSGLYNVSLCDLHSQLDILLSANSESYSEVQKNQEVDSVDPVTIPSFQRLGITPSRHPKLDSIFLISNGKMTSVDSTGKINWQIETSSSWTKSTQKNSKFFFAPTENFYTMIDFAEKSFTPSLEAFTPNRALKQTILSAIGWAEMNLIDVNGNILVSVPLPEPVIGPPVFADFDNDGTMDIILSCRSSVHGIQLQQHQGSNLFAYLIYLLTSILIVTFVRQLILTKDRKGKPKERGTD